MSSRRIAIAIAVAVAVAVVAMEPAHAQPVAAPYLHANFGDVELRRGGLGASIGYHGRLLGFELDGDRHNHFYKDKDLELIPNPCVPGVPGPCIDDDTDAWIVTGSLLAFVPRTTPSKCRLYGTAGGGVIYAWVHDAGEYNSTQLNLALSLGGGVMYRLNDWFGLRADLRYFHAFVDEDKLDGGYASDYDFARVSLGVTFTFPTRRTIER